jgi:hypothetical protein
VQKGPMSKYRSCLNRTRSLKTLRTLSVPATMDKSHSIYYSLHLTGLRGLLGLDDDEAGQSGQAAGVAVRIMACENQDPNPMMLSESLCGQSSLPSRPLRNASGSS